jgi:putative ABC transport system substrate-binding protein
MAGENVRIDYRWGGYDVTRMTLLAKELIEPKPDVLLAATYASAVALRQYTLAIPIVFTQVGDPVANGLVTNPARPEGNITGFDSYEFAIGSKWIEALKKCTPGLRRAAIVFDPGNTSWPQYLRAMEAAARSLGIQLFPLSVAR